jgi:restriction system protein
MAEKRIWGIHGGSLGDADEFFLKKGFVALGWAELGDLTKIKPDRESFKNAVAIAYPGKKPGAIPNNAGQLFRFVYEINVGDLVVYPSKRDRHVHIGRVEGPYQYKLSLNAAYPHQHAVKWISDLPRTKFSQGALYEIGSALSFFQVKNYAEEFRIAAEGKTATPSPAAQDETTAPVDLEETGQDEIAKLIAARFKGHGLARLVEAILKAQGYTTYLSPAGPDAGIDILAGAGQLGFARPSLCVQVKSGDTPVESKTLNELRGAMQSVNATEGLFVSWGGFKPTVYKQALSSFFSVRLWTQKELLENLFSSYDRLEDDLKAELPLKRIWTLAAQEEE